MAAFDYNCTARLNLNYITHYTKIIEEEMVQAEASVNSGGYASNIKADYKVESVIGK